MSEGIVLVLRRSQFLLTPHRQTGSAAPMSTETGRTLAESGIPARAVSRDLQAGIQSGRREELGLHTRLLGPRQLTALLPGAQKAQGRLRGAARIEAKGAGINMKSLLKIKKTLPFLSLTLLGGCYTQFSRPDGFTQADSAAMVNESYSSYPQENAQDAMDLDYYYGTPYYYHVRPNSIDSHPQHPYYGRPQQPTLPGASVSSPVSTESRKISPDNSSSAEREKKENSRVSKSSTRDSNSGRSEKNGR